MTSDNVERKTIEIPEITRVEGHAAVHVDIKDGQVCDVQLEVFEGTRFFEQLVIGHHYSELPHITSRVCAICSTGHVLAAAFAQEAIIGWHHTPRLRLFRELMHLGMIVESHSTHMFALALPDYVGARDLVDFATRFPDKFTAWTRLRSAGAAIQTLVGGRPFHPVNLHVGGLSSYPQRGSLLTLLEQVRSARQDATDIAEFFRHLKPAFCRKSIPSFVALIPDNDDFGYFGDRVRCTDGWEEPIGNYKQYLQESIVPYSHAKRTTARGKDMMVGSLARLILFGDRLTGEARLLLKDSAISRGDTNPVLNNLGQAIEVVAALERIETIINILCEVAAADDPHPMHGVVSAGTGVGAIECPRGTLYHAYSIDSDGIVTAADMITPSVQNSGRIELDIREVVSTTTEQTAPLQAHLETLIRAYDPCNTCATHMVQVRYR